VPDRIRGILSSTRGRLTCFFTCSPTLIILEYVWADVFGLCFSVLSGGILRRVSGIVALICWWCCVCESSEDVGVEEEKKVIDEMSRRGKGREVDEMTVHFDGKNQST
jgi:hypothetical protein